MPNSDARPIHDGVLAETLGVARTVVINRPDRRNALTPETAQYLAAHVDAAGKDADVRVVLLRGAGGHFCVGLDLRWFAELGDDGAEQAFEDGLAAFQGVVRSIVRCPLPVIAVLEGSVAGIGFDIALACDLRIAAADAIFTSAFGRMGLIPDGGSTFTLPHLVGLGRALGVLMTGESIDARSAEDMGIVNAVHPPDRIETEATALAERIAQSARGSLEGIKSLTRGPDRESLERHLDLEGRAQLAALRSVEFRARLAKFLGSRPPAGSSSGMTDH